MTAMDLDQTLALKTRTEILQGGTMIVPFETLNLLAKATDMAPVTFQSGKKKDLAILNTVAGKEIGRTFEVCERPLRPGEIAGDQGLI